MSRRVTFRAALTALLFVLLAPPDVHAGKLMSIARWAARETVKVALVEYAKHEAHENFDAFRLRFCNEDGYRREVLSSPTIKPLVADQASAEALVMETLGCGYSFGMINIVFTEALPSDFQNGKATTCQIKAIARNYSKYHLSHAVLDVEGWKVSVGDLVANTYDDVTIPSFNIRDDEKCSNSASWVNEHAKSAAALDCSIPNVAEGDCQALIAVTATIDVNKVAALENQAAEMENAKQAAEEAAREQVARRDHIYWSKILRAYYSANPEVNQSLSAYVTKPTQASQLESKPNAPYELIITKKDVLRPCTFLAVRSKASVDKGRFKLPAIPDGFAVFTVLAGDNMQTTWIVRTDDVMPLIYNQNGNVKACTPTKAGIDLTVSSWIHTIPSGQTPQWLPEELSSIRW